MISQFFNPMSMMFPQMQQAVDISPALAPSSRAVHQSHPRIDPGALPPFPTGQNPLLDAPPTLHIHLDMVGITATVHFKCQFNIDALRNYADRNEKKFVPSRCVCVCVGVCVCVRARCACVCVCVREEARALHVRARCAPSVSLQALTLTFALVQRPKEERGEQRELQDFCSRRAVGDASCGCSVRQRHMQGVLRPQRPFLAL